MAYNKRNMFMRAAKVQAIVEEHSKRGVTQEHIFRTLIASQFNISRATFYSWLSFDAGEALADLDRKEEERRRQEPMLF